ncbi:MAG: zf-HC2 domain-containing protein [Candidatus Edwardsbacteria bacterium]|nr:zf-HC2 domain-containing protein [Candidatus Edwardsbacteria bacterium]
MKKKHAHTSSHHCRRMVSAFSDYIDKDMREAVCRKVDEHLKDCPDCRVYLDTLNKTITLYRDLGDVAVPRDIQSRLFATIRLATFKKKHHKAVTIQPPLDTSG